MSQPMAPLPDASVETCDALVIGGGPAGLMAADALLASGRRVLLVEAKPSVARKFLMAGKSGLNLSKIEPFERFLSAFGAAAPRLAPMLRAFGPQQVQDWAEGLGQPCFTGSTGRLFPVAMKGSPLLRAWLARLEAAGLARRMRWRWQGWQGADALFDTPDGPARLRPAVTILACGGASWARLGSDGQWAGPLAQADVAVTPFAPANAGLKVAWSPHMAPQFGAPLKGVALSAGDLVSRGEVVMSQRGIEGGGIYPLSPALRHGAALRVDLCPDIDLATLTLRLSRPRGKQSLSNHLRKTLRLAPPAHALLMECARPLPADPAALAGRIKVLEVPHQGLRPLDEAISTAGGVTWSALDAQLMLHQRPGVFCVGEMVDWEAPTGGYLLTACLAMGLWAGRAAADWRAD